jgi:hypothetical protein
MLAGSFPKADGWGRAGRRSVAPTHPSHQLHPLVDPQVSHLRHVPFLTSVKLPHDPHASPS